MRTPTSTLAALALALAAAAGCSRPASVGIEEKPPVRPPLNVPPDSRGRMPATLSQTGAFADVTALRPARFLVPYDVNVPFWSDGATKRRWLAVPEGERIRFSASGEWGFPPGTVLVKHFELGGRRVETRLLVCGEGGAVHGASYRWRSDGSDADLVSEPVRAPVAGSPDKQPWH